MEWLRVNSTNCVIRFQYYALQSNYQVDFGFWSLVSVLSVHIDALNAFIFHWKMLSIQLQYLL